MINYEHNYNVFTNIQLSMRFLTVNKDLIKKILTKIIQNIFKSFNYYCFYASTANT